MALEDILLRVVTHPTLSAKGTELSYEELDGNFVEIYDYLAAMNSGSGLEPYNNSTAYSGTVYVSYNGNIYKHISLTTTTGVIPTSDPTKWELTSIGELAHVQGTDAWLDYGGAYQVSAQQIYELINNQVIPIETGAFIALVNSKDLLPNVIYFLTDYTRDGLFIHSIGGNRWSQNATLLLLRPDNSVAPVWISGGTYAVNAKVTWDGRVYKNLTGTNSGKPDTDGVRWQVQSPSLLNGYKHVLFEARLVLQSGTITIVSARDSELGNEYSTIDMLYDILGTIQDNTSSIYNVACPNSSIVQASRLSGIVATNKLTNSSFGFELGGELGGSGISNNILLGSVILSQGKFDGTIENSTLLNTELSFPDGADSSLAIQGSRFYFSGRTALRIRANAGTISAVDCDNHGSNAEDTIDISGASSILLDDNGYPDVYGVINLTSTNSSENISKIENGANIFPLIIKPEAGLLVNIGVVTPSGVSSDGEIIGNSATSFSLNGDNGDYMVVYTRTIGAYTVYQVERIIKNQ
jgi:hypothetical protein